jgi:hypothetical protein
MEELLQCRCGHGISAHSGSGCDGDRFRPCRCVRARGDVLDAAINSVRTDFSPAAPSTNATYVPRS